MFAKGDGEIEGALSAGLRRLMTALLPTHRRIAVFHTQASVYVTWVGTVVDVAGVVVVVVVVPTSTLTNHDLKQAQQKQPRP